MSHSLSRRLFHSPCGLAIASILLLAAIDTALTVTGAVRPWDEAATSQVYQWIRPWLNLPTVALTYLGSWQGLLVIVLAVAAWAMVRGERLDALLLLGVLAVALIAQEVAKQAVRSPRPYIIQPPSPITPLDSYGYVSGHSLQSMAVLGFAVVVLWGLVERRWVRWSLLGGGSLLIVGVGFSRVYLGLHWVNDVVGGYLYGGIILLMVCLVRVCSQSRW